MAKKTTDKTKKTAKETEQKKVTTNDSSQVEIKNTSQGNEASNKIAKAIFDGISITSCSDLVQPPTVDTGGYGGNVSCGSGFNFSGALADASLSSGHKWRGKDKTNNLKKGEPCGTAASEALQKGSTVRLVAHMDSRYCGWCTTSVSGHIQKGGILWNTRSGYGLEMKNYLPSKGFNDLGVAQNLINTRSAIQQWQNVHAMAGDVCCMTHGANSWSRSSNGAGHACMYDGKYWVSDCYQNGGEGALCYCSGKCTFKEVHIMRFSACKAGSPSSSNDVSSKLNTDSKKLLTLKYVREKETNKYSYGRFYINGEFYCWACDTGIKEKTICPDSKSHNSNGDGHLKKGITYTVFLRSSTCFTAHANNPNEYWSPEFGKWYKQYCMKNGSVELATVCKPNAKKADDKIPVMRYGKSDTGSGILIHAGRGSINSTGCVVLGSARPIESNGGCWFHTTAKDTQKVDLSNTYQSDWNVYQKFYELYYSVAKSNNGKIGTLEIA